MIKEHKSGEWSPDLTADEYQTLFQIAEDTLQWCVNEGEGEFTFSSYAISDALRVPTATFVTLNRQGQLRGCIGSLAPVAPMYESVHDNAVNAAMHDFRFPPVRPAELPLLDVHISLLSPITDIPGPEGFKLGEHGIIVSKAGRRAVFLPEVAIDQGWTREQTLSQLCIKAGLSSDAWQSGAGFQVFSSVVLERAD